MDVMDEDERDPSLCQAYGHQDEDILFEDEEFIQWYCHECGAEWEEFKDFDE